MQNLIEEKIKMYITHIGPMIAIANSYITAKNIKNTGYKISILSFIIPSVFLFFFPPLLANLVYKQMVIDDKLFISYLLGSVLFLSLGYNKVFDIIFNPLTVFGKINLLLAMKKNGESLSKIAMWLIICNFSGSILLKSLGGKHKFSVDRNQILDILSSVLIVAISRNFMKNDLIVISGVFVVKLSFELEKIAFKYKKKREESSENNVEEKEPPKTPRKRVLRKAAKKAAGIL